MTPEQRRTRALVRKLERARAKKAAQRPLRNAYAYGREMKRADLEARGFVELDGHNAKEIGNASGSKLWSLLSTTTPRPFDDKRRTPETWTPLWVEVVWNAVTPKGRHGFMDDAPCPRRDWRNIARAFLARPNDCAAVEAAYRLAGLEAATVIVREVVESLKPARARTLHGT